MLCAPFRQRGADLAVRSEHVLLAPPGDGVPATVQVAQPLGPSTVVTAAWDGGALTARVPGITALPPGESVSVRLDPVGNGTNAAMSSKMAKV